MVMRTHVEMVRVRYGETDKMGVAHHSSYLLWFELGRTGLLRAAGHSYRGLEAEGVMLPVVEYGATFLKGAHYDDELAIETKIREMKSRVITFDYRVRRGEEIISRGFTRHVWVDTNSRPRRLPDGVTEAITPFLASGD
ncbi:MAG: acyl-CoA thioesterase [Candidatus Krumholzibacteria bacterium]|nr:acyl-CoA thioesterase [Candidatus Krumholzibacteria bacterium]MDH4335950.1 acyl-CoA thioesterase [Candidatus Krumholzibacteria bacterium]MDH5268474.1 acyl-CoA thioesterase [Candidatus Krumholzibacteria bacterium]MDH5627698.1 acyl-CoA thioesterase [Candidatus Krumholzibacteria bacterium]